MLLLFLTLVVISYCVLLVFILTLNPFHATGLFRYPMKTSEQACSMEWVKCIIDGKVRINEGLEFSELFNKP